MAVGDTNLFLSRDTRVFLEQDSNIWEIPVLNGYSFSQTTNASTITLAEMSDTLGNSRRGQRVFNDSLSPAEWSFDVYVRPTVNAGDSNKMYAVEEALWANFVAANAFTSTWAYGVTRDTSKLDFDFDDSNKTELGIFNLYFVLGASTWYANTTSLNFTTSEDTTIYKVTGCVVNEATINFEIDGIATISWSGMGATIGEVTSFDASAAIRTGIDVTTNLIRNRLTSLAATSAVSGTAKTISSGSITSNVATINTGSAHGLVATDTVVIKGITGTYATLNGVYTVASAPDTDTITIAYTAADGSLTLDNATVTKAVDYDITLTGGSITLSNNISFLTPESLGQVNVPLGHVTGTRSVSGTFTCYLDEKTDGSIDLYEDLLGATGTVTNQFFLDFYVGGKDTTDTPVAPGLQFKMKQCHLEIPAIRTDDVIGLDVNFTGLPETISGTDEISRIRYVGV